MRNISKIVVFYTDGTVDEVPFYPSGGGGGKYYPGVGGGGDLNTYNPSVCPKCGIHLQALMSYSCPNLKCPTGMGPITCKT